MKTYLPIGVAVVLIAVTAWVQGNWSERWSTFPELELFAKQLEHVPLTVGDWQGKDLGKMDDRIRAEAGAEGELSRTYTRGQDVVQVNMVCGRLRDVFYHTPDRCFTSQGFEMPDEPVRQPFELETSDPSQPQKAEFLTATFRKSDVSGEQAQRLYWSWCARGPWEAPSEPKWTFAGEHALYKLYVSTASGREAVDQNAATDFIKVFLPELQKALAPATSAAAAAQDAKK